MKIQRNYWLKALSLVLAFSLLLGSVPNQVIALTGEALLSEINADDTATLQVEQELLGTEHIVEEDTSKRGESYKEYILNNGLRLATIYPSAIHYEDDGVWKDIDNTLIATLSGGSTFYTNTAGKWNVRFPQSLDDTNRIRVMMDGFTVQFGMAGELRSSGGIAVASADHCDSVHVEHLTVGTVQTATAQIEQVDMRAAMAEAEYPETVLGKLYSRLTYGDVYPNTDIVYDLQSSCLKESVILKQYDSTLYGYRYHFDFGGLIPVLGEDRRIDLCDPQTGEVVLTMPAPYLLDHDGEYSYDVEVSLVSNGNGYLLSYYLPREWLADVSRSWPVILDPVIEKAGLYSNIKDRTVGETITEPYNHPTVQCGYYNSGIMRFFVKYISLPAITSGDVIVDASISFYKPSNSSTTAVIEAHKVLDTWESETITWANKPDFNPLIEDYVVCKNAGRYTWDITDIVRGWYSGENTGMMFKVSDAVEQAQMVNWKQFWSSDYDTNTANIPMLCITFRNANGLENYWDYTVSSASRAGTGYVNNYNGNLVWIRNDIGFDGNRMPVSISHIYNANDSHKNLFGMGYGWRTNYNQRVYQWSQNANYYVWEDSDGTQHYFYKVANGTYVDEDGLYLILTTTGSGNEKYQIEDQYGNKSYFNEDGYLVKIANNQNEKSVISISYENSLIKEIEDGAGRAYVFTYTNGLLSHISYQGSGSSEISYVDYSYTNSCLTGITDKDGKSVVYAYGDRNLLLSAQDIDGYKLVYTYNLIDTVALTQPSRVASITEFDGDTQGGRLNIEYENNQTTFTDHNGNVQIQQFNHWGNPVAVMDGEGRGQFATYYAPESRTEKGNQLRLTSKLQNTVGNMLQDNSFERGTVWTNLSSACSCTVATEAAYYGAKSLRLSRTAAGDVSGAQSVALVAQPGASYTFSAYVKTGIGMTVTLAISDGSNVVISDNVEGDSEWTRVEVTYTNTAAYNCTIYCQILTSSAGIAYVDCVQMEKAPTASRYNLVDNGDFRYNTAWTVSAASANNACVMDSAAAPQLDTHVYQLVGNPQSQLHLKQDVAVSGNAGDTFVLTGWAKGDAAPLTNVNRAFCLRGVFTYADGSSSKPFDFSFNPDTDNWQYAAGMMLAEQAYTKITVYAVYDYNVNAVMFDGIQLYKEEFGSSFTYDGYGNVTAVKDIQGQTTSYSYNAATHNLEQITLPDGTVTSYTYDEYHNVLSAVSDTGVVYTYTYDDWGNNLSVSVGSGTSKITSSAAYSDDGNRIISSTDSAGKVTLYSYNADTNVLEWVQYPEDTAATRTSYTYDEMYRLTATQVTTDQNRTLTAGYTYTNDLLTELETASTTYSFTYGSFGLRSGVYIGQRTLAQYTYTAQNNFLERLDYGNGDSVQYEYDNLGRVISQTYEDGDTVTYRYDNNGALASVTDSATGRTTTYYYDFTNRLMRYVESGTNYDHSVGYTYNTLNQLTDLTEIIDGVTHTTHYAYDDDGRVATMLKGSIALLYNYDAYGRDGSVVLRNTENSWTMNRVFTYLTANNSPTSRVANMRYQAPGFNSSFTYSYDDNGNILSVNSSNSATTYVYDSMGQLLRENNQAAGKTWVWTYDNAGNILSKTEYAYTTGALGAALDTVVYTYGDAEWGDLLTAYDGVPISYDAMGNPIRDGTWTYAWEHGRQLAQMKRSGAAWYFTYDADGMRTQRRASGATYTYVYNGGQLSRMTYNGAQMHFTYDASGNPLSVTFNGSTYYYVVNLQGDVVAILNSTGTQVVGYTYGAWGRLLTTTGTMANTLGYLNPLRYRGYVYDQETELYYLQTRYYNPALGRFLNADALVSTGQGILGNNMFAYCRNNPVSRRDVSGTVDLEEYWDDGSDGDVYNEPIDPDDVRTNGGNPQNSATPSGGNTGAVKSNNVAKSGNSNKNSSHKASNFRNGLKKITGQQWKGKHAHHVFPKKFAKQFSNIGIDVNDPKHGAWWEASSHLKSSYEYNEIWKNFLLFGEPTKEDALDLAHILAEIFGFDWNL